MNICDQDVSYRRALQAVPSALQETYAAIVANGPLPLGDRQVTRAILLRLRAYYEAQNRSKEFLGKRYVAAGADFFVETILFYLRALIDTYALRLDVASERQIKPTRNALRPDLSLWRGEELIAAIECKTQLGWNRSGWREDFQQRELILKDTYPGVRVFLLVMTTQNWPGFDEGEAQGFALFSQWPLYITDSDIDERIVRPIEDLFRQIVALDQALGSETSMEVGLNGSTLDQGRD